MPVPLDLLYAKRRRSLRDRLVDRGFFSVTLALAALIFAILAAIIVTIFTGSIDAFARFGLRFLTTSAWNPVANQYGAFTAIYGTLTTSILALFVAIPLGVGTAVFLTENLMPLWSRQIIGVMIELLAAIPSVVLGLWAIFVMEPVLRPVLAFFYSTFSWNPLFSTPPQGPGMTPAILILVVMILPIITAISRDSLLQVPAELRQAAYGIGTTRWGAIMQVILPAAISGITGGVMLALGRAMGETMAVTMIIGNSNNFSFSLLAPGNTISAMLASQFGEADGLQVSALMYAAFVLMIMTLVVNVMAQWVVRRLSLKYN